MHTERKISLPANEKCTKLIVLVADVYYMDSSFFTLSVFVGKCIIV